MIDPSKIAFTALYVARQMVRDSGDRCTVDEALAAVRSDMLLGLLPEGSFGWSPDAALRQLDDDYPWTDVVRYVVEPAGGVAQAELRKVHSAVGIVIGGLVRWPRATVLSRQSVVAAR